MAGGSSATVLRGQPSRDPRASALRALAMDAVQQANSGHPGAPMGMAEMAVALWGKHLRHNPTNPSWIDRDRFVLSNGHASMLLYALLHLTGYALSMDELKRFRQFGSRTPGHPEVGVTPGVETTTGPLGQGLANAVGMALAEQRLAREFNRPQHVIVDHHTYAFVGDGCLMEGISQEAISLAGLWGLGKLIVLYDDNGISIDGPVAGWFADDTAARFRACGWQVVEGVDGHAIAAVEEALVSAQQDVTRPSLIMCRTTIGAGSPNRAGSAKAHGEPLGAIEIAATRAAIGWPHAAFDIPPAIRAQWDARHTGAEHEARWQRTFDDYRAAYPQPAQAFERRMAGDLGDAWSQISAATLAHFDAATAAVATRKSSQMALAIIGPGQSELLGGSADLSGSNLTDFPDAGERHISYGVREFGMAAVMNGLALHGGFIPYAGTFLTFSDYSRNAIRMAALMHLRVIHVFTHDSIGLGEDGPTHQPIEHVASLRLIPNLDVWRPADGVETAVAWLCAIERRDGPTALALSRQGTPALITSTQVADVRRGAYVLSDAPAPQAVIIATGTETALALQAQAELAREGISTRVVSMPCTTLFDRQDEDYRADVLRPALPAVAIEAGHPDFWRKYVGRHGAAIGLSTFGESAPAEALYAHFGITAKAVVDAVRQRVARP